MNPSKPIKEWSRVFLDTSVIIDYLKNPESQAKNPALQRRIIDTQALIKIITALDNEGNTKCRFYVSAITISELTRKSLSDSVAQDIIQTFNSADVVFVDYTKTIANELQKSLANHLPEEHKREFLRELTKSRAEINSMNARAWVSDDLKIIASSKIVKGLDVILTADKQTFYPITEKMGIPCMVTDRIPYDLFGKIDTEIVLEPHQQTFRPFGILSEYPNK